MPLHRLIFHRLTQNKLAAAALVVVLAYILIAIFVPWIAPYRPLAISNNNLAPPSWHHLLGTDQLGRDILSRILYGTRLSLRVAAFSVAFALIVGTIVGLPAGYFGGWVDATLSRCTDVMFAVPEILMALIVMAILGQGINNITLAIGIVYAPIFARICRAAVLRVKGQPFIEAARALGLPHRRVMLRHILPNIAAPLIVQTTLSLAFAVLAEAALSFLGLAGQSDMASWGMMLREGKDWMQQAWWVAVFPGIAITLAVFSLNVLGDGLRDALDPRTID